MNMALLTTADLICDSVSRRAADGDEPKDRRLGEPVLTPTDTNTPVPPRRYIFPHLDAERK